MNKPAKRIFISYRRSDALGFAGRLSDSLESYFGKNRIFRDIEDIAGGADFEEVIKSSLESAIAVIVLIGPRWTSITDTNGNPRLGAARDYVTAEISMALELGIPIYPVLIEETPMPRPNELPDALTLLVRFNALTISDKRWDFDVERLGKVISLDIPSPNERILRRVKIAVSLGLSTTLTLSAAIICWNFLRNEEVLIQYWQSGIPFVAVAISALLLTSIKDLITTDKRPYLIASIVVGGVGSFLFFALQVVLEQQQEPMILFFGSTLVITTMFALLLMSGLSAK